MRKVLLCGNPNTGKTTLFNTLSKSNEKASNWHGVTVGVKEKVFKIKDENFILCDLPGIYSFNGLSEEEKISSNYIIENKDEMIVCVVDANNLKRNLLLVLEIKNITNNLIVAVNMANEVKCLDEKKLSENLGVKVVCIDARKKKSVNKLKSAICDFNIKTLKQNNEFSGFLSNVINDKLDKFENYVQDKFGYIDELLVKSGYDKIGAYGQSKLDKVLLNPFLAPLIFLGIMALTFFITFGFIGEIFTSMFNGFMNGVAEEVFSFLSVKLKNDNLLLFLKEGIISGVLTVLGFLPQILLMSLCLNILEDFGYLSRVSVMFDGYLKKIGLSGKSIFSLVMGFGCTTSAVITTRNLGLKEERGKTVLALPFVSCSAKLPVYSVICSVFFAKYKAFCVFCLYIFAILLMVLVMYIFKCLEKTQNDNFFILELPKYRVPKLKKVFMDSFSVVKSFVLKIGFSILISSVVVYLLYNLNFKMQVVTNKAESIIYVLADKFSFILAPLGLNMAGVLIALISGLVAKEMVVSSLVIINSCDISVLGETLIDSSSVVHFSSLTSIVFLVFVLLYSPCVSSLISVRKELGVRVMFKSFLLQSFIAYLVSFIVYILGLFVVKGMWWLSLILCISLAIIMIVVIKLIKRKNIHVETNIKCLNCEGNRCGNY